MKPIPLLFLALFACKPHQPALPPAQTPATVTDSVRPVQRSIDSTVPPVDLQAWFALPDTTGTLLVCMGRDFLGPGPFFLVTLEGNTAPLVDLGIRARNEHGSGRDISRDFGDVGGHLFRISGDQVVRDRSYLVVSSRDSLLSARYPGGTSDSESVWRVEDGGQFDGCRLGLIAAFRSVHGIEIVHSWAGAEGDYDALLQQSADTFTALVDGSRYWSPQ